jgi:hypothetical protein
MPLIGVKKMRRKLNIGVEHHPFCAKEMQKRRIGSHVPALRSSG